MPRDRRAAERRGRRGEMLAALALMLKGYRVLDRRLRLKVGEIDLIARKGDVICFIEVKVRATEAAAVDAVTPRNRRRIERAAEMWRARRPELDALGWRYDIVVVCPGRWPKHLRDAWRPGL